MFKKHSQKVRHLMIASFLFISNGLYGENPNHLEPISPVDMTNFRDIMYKTLIHQDHLVKYWMVDRGVMGSPPSAIMLRKKTNLKGETEWTLEYAVAQEALKAQLIFIDKEFVIHKLINKVKRYEVKVSADFAHKTQKAWKDVLKQTRYANTFWKGLDGVTYDFGSFPYYGTTWSPKSGLPKQLVELGKTLMLLTKTTQDSDEYKALIKQSLAKADEINAQIKPKKNTE